IVQNPLIRGLSPGRIEKAFTSFHVFNYNPLHIVSYMIDYELWGLRPGGFFFTSLLFHILGGVLLYFFSLRWLRSPQGALLVAAVFLVHPTRVESVAWLSERKDVLSGVFGAASLLSYLGYLEVIESRGQARLRIVASWLFFLFALFSKSQLVTLPLVLWAMDIWKRRPLGLSLLEKTPFFLLSILFSIITLCAHKGDA